MKLSNWACPSCGGRGPHVEIKYDFQTFTHTFRCSTCYDKFKVTEREIVEHD